MDRRRWQAELLKRGQDVRTDQKKPGGALKKRFWKDVNVQIDSGKLMHKPNVPVLLGPTFLLLH